MQDNEGKHSLPIPLTVTACTARLGGYSSVIDRQTVARFGQFFGKIICNLNPRHNSSDLIVPEAGRCDYNFQHLEHSISEPCDQSNRLYV